MDGAATPKNSIRDVNTQTLEAISQHIDTLLALSQPDAELRMHANKFQLEHASAKVEYQQASPTPFEPPHATSSPPLSREMVHLKRVLTRMVDFALTIAQDVLRKVLVAGSKVMTRSPSIESVIDSPLSRRSDGFAQVDMSSVTNLDDLEEEDQIRVGHVMHSALEVLSLGLLAHPDPQLLMALQSQLDDRGVLVLLAEGLSIDREVEQAWFAEGFKTDVMKIVANLTFENAIISRKIVDDDKFFAAVLSSTRIDEDNLGIGEWAEFAIRNMCLSDSGAREKLKKVQRPTAASGSTAPAPQGQAKSPPAASAQSS